jgi:cyanophycinase
MRSEKSGISCLWCTIEVWLCATAFLLSGVITPVHGQEKIPAPEKAPLPLTGTLVIVGGGKTPDSVIAAFVKAAGGEKAELVVIPTASASADKDPAQKTIELWQKRGIARVSVLHTRSTEKANDPAFCKPLAKATAIWIGGGDQKRLTDAYKGTLLEKEMHRLLERGGAVGGTSAGAAVMSKLMISGGNVPANLAEGFGCLPNAVVDQHFLKRNRVDRLLEVLHRNPGWFGLGIDESTAAVVQGRTITIVGDSMAMVCQRSTPSRPASCRVLHAGDQIDLVDCSLAALQRGEVLKTKIPGSQK